MDRARAEVIRTAVTAVTPLAVLVAVYLFFAGHNQPGGGFAAGLVLGAVVMLRTMAGLPLRIDPLDLLAVGALVVVAVSVAPVVAGEAVLDQIVVKVDVPVLGTVKSGSAAVFDAGVTLIVVGLMSALVGAMGAPDVTASVPSRPNGPGEDRR